MTTASVPRPRRTGASDATGQRAARRSRRLLWWIPASPIVGFALAGWLLPADWPLSAVIPLVVILASPFALGAGDAVRALRRGQSRMWLPLVLHLAFLVLAVVLPISESQ